MARPANEDTPHRPNGNGNGGADHPLLPVEAPRSPSIRHRGESRSPRSRLPAPPLTPPPPLSLSKPPPRRRRFGLRVKLAVAASLLAATLWISTIAIQYFRYDVEVFGRYHREVDDGGPGRLWIPPEERPIPLDAFPKFSKALLVKSEIFGNSKRRWNGKPTPPPVLVGGVGGRNGTEPPPTLLFMHLWKCAGSSLRHLLRDWSALEEQSIAIVVRCTDVVSKENKVCLQKHELINTRIQGPYIRQNQVLAGHFTWGFQEHVRQPYVMFTTLRNPLELFVSGQQYLNRKATRVLSNAVDFVGEMMQAVVDTHKGRLRAAGTTVLDGGGMMPSEGQGGKSIGYIYRLVNSKTISRKTLDEASKEAMANLDTFWLVGVIEQYKGFMAVLHAMMDPDTRHKRLWKTYAVGKYNASPNGADRVLAGIDPDLVREFNATLSQQWKVYDYAVGLYGERCRQILHKRDLKLCNVPRPPAEYVMTNVEREELYQQGHPGLSYEPVDIIRAQNLWAEFNSSTPVIKANEVWDLFEGYGYNMSDSARRENLWSRLGIRAIFHASGPWPEGYDWKKARWEGMTDVEREELYQKKSRAVSFNATEMVLAKSLWAQYEEDSSHPVPLRADDVWRFFERFGFNLSADPRKTENLWARLRLRKVFHPSGPWPDGFDPNKSAVDGFNSTELLSAEKLWEGVKGTPFAERAGPVEALRLFEENGFDLSDPARRAGLWGFLGIVEPPSYAPHVDAGIAAAREADIRADAEREKSRMEEKGEPWERGEGEKKAALAGKPGADSGPAARKSKPGFAGGPAEYAVDGDSVTVNGKAGSDGGGTESGAGEDRPGWAASTAASLEEEVGVSAEREGGSAADAGGLQGDVVLADEAAPGTLDGANVDLADGHQDTGPGRLEEPAGEEEATGGDAAQKSSGSETPPVTDLPREHDASADQEHADDRLRDGGSTGRAEEGRGGGEGNSAPRDDDGSLRIQGIGAGASQERGAADAGAGFPPQGSADNNAGDGTGGGEGGLDEREEPRHERKLKRGVAGEVPMDGDGYAALNSSR